MNIKVKFLMDEPGFLGRNPRARWIKGETGTVVSFVEYGGSVYACIIKGNKIVECNIRELEVIE